MMLPVDRHLKSIGSACSRTTTIGRIALLGLLLALATGCAKREVIHKSKVQQKQIQQLQDELAGLEAELKSLPPDRAKDIAENQKRLEDLDKAAAKLGPEIEALETRKAALEKEFISYRAQHPLKSR